MLFVILVLINDNLFDKIVWIWIRDKTDWDDTTNVHTASLYLYSSGIINGIIQKRIGASIRCVKD